jgi:hypothetical protein
MMWRLIRKNRMAAALAAAAAFMMPAWGSTTEPRTAVPGTLNYVEGQASIGSQALDSGSIGYAELQSGQSLTTQKGKAEFLLTPGVFVRLGDDSSAKMISPELTNTELALTQGEAIVEVDQIHPENDIRIDEAGTSTRLLKTGIYDFDAAHDQVRVFDGKAMVVGGDRKTTVKGGHELALNATDNLKVRGFDKKQYANTNDLYRWSSLRSAYLANANENTAQIYVADGWYGPGWIGAGWYWSPWFGAYTFIPGNGFLYSPFGWGFYSPLWVHRAPLYGYPNYYHHFPNSSPSLIGRVGPKPGPVYGPGFHGGAVRSFDGGLSSGGELHANAAPERAVPFVSPGGHMGGFHAGGMGGGFRR